MEEETRKVNKAIKHTATKDITDNLIKAGSIWFARQLGLRKPTRGKQVEPCWKRRVEGENREGSEHIAERKPRRNQIKLKG